MSLLDQAPEVWAQAAAECNPEDIVDIADQIAILRDHGADAIASEVQVQVGQIVTARLHDGDLHPTLAHHYFQQSSGYDAS